MKEDYDFSKGERGKFFRSDARLNLPVYLDDDVLEFVEKIAQKKNIDSLVKSRDLPIFQKWHNRNSFK